MTINVQITQTKSILPIILVEFTSNHTYILTKENNTHYNAFTTNHS